MSVGKKLFAWTLFILVLGTAVGLYTYFMLLKDARTPYEVTVEFDHKFEMHLLNAHPALRFIPIGGNVQFHQTYREGKNFPAFELVSSLEFFKKLEGDETILVITERRDNGVARIYALHAELPTLTAYEELIPMPEGTSQIKTISFDEIIFEKWDSSEVVLVSGIGGGTFFLWFTGFAAILFIAISPK